MKNIAVICEYNPFHMGHLYQIERIREIFGECRIISIMSGNFVQRGESAVLDKYIRARWALENGSDLVLELTPPYSFAPAEIFAKAGVHIADSIGADVLVFGSECGDIDKLKKTAHRLRSKEFANALDQAVSANTHSEKSYIRIRAEVYESLFGGGLPDTPNDILALEYLSALRDTGIEPYSLKRKSGYSALSARKAFCENDLETLKKTVPQNVFDSLSDSTDNNFKRGSAFEKMIFYKLLSESPEALSSFEECEASLAYRLYDAAIFSADLTELVSRATTKKYTSARIKRALLNLLFGIKKGAYKTLPGYTEVLAANESGRSYLREISKTARINIVTKPANGPTQFCDELYSLASGCAPSDAYRKAPFIK